MSQESFKSPDFEEPLTVRELLDVKQAHLDHVMFDLAEEVEVWNLRLAEVSQESDESKDATLANMAQEATVSLDKKWPFMGDYIHVSGSWYVPKVEIGGSTIQFPMDKKEAFNVVRSNGFSVFEKPDGAPTVGLSFIINDIPLTSAAVQGNLTLLTYADIQDVSMYYARPQDIRGEYSTRLDQIGQCISYYDSLLMLHYHNKNSEFFKKSVKQQKRFLNEIVDGISDSLPMPGFGEIAKCEQVTTPYVYQRVESNGRSFWEKITAPDGENLMLSGNIDGVGILEATELDHGKPLRDTSELVDPYAGICLVLRVEQSSIPDRFNNYPVYVPLRPADELEIAVG